MACGACKTGLTCALQFNIVLFGDLQNMLTLFCGDLPSCTISFDECEMDLLGESEFIDAED